MVLVLILILILLDKCIRDIITVSVATLIRRGPIGDGAIGVTIKVIVIGTFVMWRDDLRRQQSGRVRRHWGEVRRDGAVAWSDAIAVAIDGLGDGGVIGDWGHGVNVNPDGVEVGKRHPERLTLVMIWTRLKVNRG